MYRTLGIHWASSVPAFLALACLPFPFLFYKYGASIRKKCKYASQSEAFMEKIRLQAASRSQPQDRSPASDSDSSLTRAEATAEQEVIDYSFEDEKQPQGRFQTMRAANETSDGGELQKVATGRSNRSRRSVRTIKEEYDGNPYEIDRVNTRESFRRARAESAASRIGNVLGKTKSKQVE